MQVLYVSALASEFKINNEYKATGNNPGFAVQKFSRLLVSGLMANGANVQVFSNPPNLSEKNKLFVSCRNEAENGIFYKYAPYINIPLLKHICIFLYAFFYVLFWSRKDKENKSIICDVLSISICMGALCASKLRRIQSVGLVTDIYGLMAGKKGILMSLAEKLNALYVASFDMYVLLTEQMNGIVNVHCKPFIVMEGLCDASKEKVAPDYVQKSSPRVVLYAGGIYEKYGLKMLAEAFVEANVENAKLVYYGSGPYVEEYKKLCKKHINLEYRGIAPNDVIVSEEYKATLLVNPRFTKEEFTKYSFPSKNMEYMSTGTPLLTTDLPGMPTEYHRYVLLFKDETVESYASSIRYALELSDCKLKNLGMKARQFVFEVKNNVVQAKRVLDMITDA